ncbi:MAG: aspartate aminotransferase [Candidatus Lambdaproteobacteria bacterium RIFOXYD2_FULL_50_16]|uniref:Aspartate aminotransferase n=1 Tax=Candidatus Lambdaproteobacteria bacterium RIFOXYD2_FULL_50_16 TaxID=1817772 RepID=A0A1F6GDV9_9PROT|nr:MAG: aspartate aminotransferase [Candidatus Lambdaproteobacteria bacterium RIFOXYD2_FULL_50_16]
MAIAKALEASIQGSSLIRAMFEEGERRKIALGPDKVFDFSLGNPVFEPPLAVVEALKTLTQSEQPGTHRYMPNAGYKETRDYIASLMADESGLAFLVGDICMCVGAGGALNVILKCLLDPGDEVIVIRPYFVEYDYYFKNHGGQAVPVLSGPGFQIDLAAIEAAIGPKTKAVLINSPNNPTGVIYDQKALEALGGLLTKKSAELGRVITLISDEPYRALVYDEVKPPCVFNSYNNVILATSSSKDLALPGERIGYLAISPLHQDRALLGQAAPLALRTLGFVNAPALMQRLLPMVKGAKVDIEPYRINRDLLYNHLTSLGLDCVKPQGAFYLFPKCPIADDLLFCEKAQALNLLVVPGRAFGLAGYFRIAYCFQTEMIRRSLPVFTELIKGL